MMNANCVLVATWVFLPCKLAAFDYLLMCDCSMLE